MPVPRLKPNYALLQKEQNPEARFSFLEHAIVGTRDAARGRSRSGAQRRV
jgi:hypothetical protein